MGWEEASWAAWTAFELALSLQPEPPQLPVQRLPRGVVLRPGLLPHRLAGGAPPCVRGAGGGTPSGQAGGGGSDGGGRAAAVDECCTCNLVRCRSFNFVCLIAAAQVTIVCTGMLASIAQRLA